MNGRSAESTKSGRSFITGNWFSQVSESRQQLSRLRWRVKNVGGLGRFPQKAEIRWNQSLARSPFGGAGFSAQKNGNRDEKIIEGEFAGWLD